MLAAPNSNFGNGNRAAASGAGLADSVVRKMGRTIREDGPEKQPIALYTERGLIKGLL
jgi:hypothetical protein